MLFVLVFMIGACGGGGPVVVEGPEASHDTRQLAPTEGPPSRDEPRAAPSAPPLLDLPRVARTQPSLTALPVLTDPGELPTLYEVDTKKEKQERVALPLKQTRVVAELGDQVAEVEVTQRFENPHAQPIEVAYVFPLPENAAVTSMKMKIGDRTVDGKIARRDRARAVYEDAKQRGYATALLEQERANIFTQSVANIEPRRPIEIVVRYVQDLTYDAGVRELVFPLVIGPRFVPGQPLDRAPSGAGTAKDTNAVPDASRISPPRSTERSGRDVSIDVFIEPELVQGSVEAVSHAVNQTKQKDKRVRVSLAKKDKLDNRDFVLRYRVARPDPHASLLLNNEDGGYFSLVVDPPEIDVDAAVGRREMIFVVDVSGSMKGAPLALSKRAMRIALEKIRPTDTFNVISFSGRTDKLFYEPREANEANIEAALAFIDEMSAGGGTMMLDAIDAALSADVAQGRDRYVFFLTDGFVSIEDAVTDATRSFVDTMKKKNRRARVFGFGVGPAPNRALLESMSREGDGVALYATSREDPARAVNAFFRYTDRSVLRDVTIDWGGAKVTDLTPAELPDLFASHPMVLRGRLDRAPTKRPILRATSAAGPIEIPVDVLPPKQGHRRDVLGVLWARARIGELDADFAAGDPTAKRAIEELGTQFGLASRFTSYVAVDLAQRVGEESTITVNQHQFRSERRDQDGVDDETGGGGLVDAERTADGEKKHLEKKSDEGAGAGDAKPDATAPSAGAYDRETAVIVRSEPAYRRGCACEAVGQSATTPAVAVPFCIGLAVMFLRRRRRRDGDGSRSC
ncbi:MAG: VWA domain-containing protein [Polyangiaceae bacterium]|nr:VWA domain-containing protein [Polyangiaceae bacterium]